MNQLSKINDYVNLDELGRFCRSKKGIAIIMASLGTSYALYATLKTYLLRKKYKHIPGPPTNGIVEFFVGQHFQFAENIKKNSYFVRLLNEWSRLYGPIFKFQQFNNIMVVATDQDLIKEIVLHKNYPKHPIFYHIFGFPFEERFIGHGIETEINHEKWKQRRNMLNPFFQKKVLMSFIDDFNSRSNILIQHLNTLADGKTVVTMLDEMNKTTLDVIGKVAFGLYKEEGEEDKDITLNRIIADCMSSLSYILNDPFASFKPSLRPYIKKMRSSITELREFSMNIINHRLNEIKTKEAVQDDLLTAIVKNTYVNGKLDYDEMVDEFITFYVAGQETTSNTLSFGVLELAKHPEVYQKLREEVDRVIGSRTVITNDDLNNMTYLNCVFKETLRLWPTGSHLHRLITEDLVFKEYRIPKGTWFILSPFVIQRNEKYFPKPDEFIPERFMKDSEFGKQNIINPYTYMPFSLGHRNCIGQNFANIQGRIILAKLAQNFDIRLDPTQNMDAGERTTIRPADGTRVYLTNRG